MILAEKIVTAIDRGEQNTRWRDFVDIVAITRNRAIQLVDLRCAIDAVATYRAVVIEPLAPLLEQLPGRAQAKWATWRRRQRLSDSTPEKFEELLTEYLAFTEPALASDARSGTWESSVRSWKFTN